MAMAKVGGANTQLSACAAVPHWQELGQTAQNRCSCASHMVLLACRHKQRWNIQSFLFRAIFIWTWQLNCINLEDCLESTGFPLLRKATSCTYPFHIGFRNHEKEKETVPPKKNACCISSRSSSFIARSCCFLFQTTNQKWMVFQPFLLPEAVCEDTAELPAS